jgi:hypothetical protein
MRNLIVGLLCLAGLSSSAFAQFMTGLVVDVPFAFNVGDAQLPAGEYRISRVTDVGHVIGFRPAAVAGFTLRTILPGANSIVAINSTYVGRTPVPSRVVFNKYGEDRYFVASVWHPGGSVQLPKSRKERELITSRITASVAPQVVTIAARQIR